MTARNRTWHRDGLTIYTTTPDGERNAWWALIHSNGRVHIGEASVEECERVATLMCAAPKLLDALEAMLGAFDTPIARRRMGDAFSEEARAMARAAVQEAKGE
jgi:hypothetical protein